MIVAFYCVALGGLIPILWVSVAKLSAGYRLKNNANPREFLAKQTGLSARANAAQANSWEAFAPFAAAVIIAYVAGADHSKINTLALLYTGFRLAYGVAYLADAHMVRSIVWGFALLCNLALYGLLI
jgi:uncharacterized MAPEG superfamily protein